MDRSLFVESSQLSEASYDAAKGELTLTVITPGKSKNNRTYPEAVLKRDFGVFKGNKMFANHQTSEESRTRPEGDINQWVASLRDVWAESDGRVRGKAVIIDPPFKEKLARLSETGMLGDMGVSIRTVAEARKDETDPKGVVVERLLVGRSVDFVTYAAAGGRVEAMESVTNDGLDLDLVTEAQLRERRPDLVTAITTSSHEGKESSTMEKTLEVQLQEAKAELATATAQATTQAAEITTLKATVATMESAGKKSMAAAALATMLTESKLPKIAADRLRKQFETAESTDGMKEAVDAEVTYIKSLAPGAKVVNLGEGHQQVDDDSVKEPTVDERKKSWMLLGMNEAEATIAANSNR